MTDLSPFGTEVLKLSWTWCIFRMICDVAFRKSVIYNDPFRIPMDKKSDWKILIEGTLESITMLIEHNRLETSGIDDENVQLVNLCDKPICGSHMCRLIRKERFTCKKIGNFINYTDSWAYSGDLVMRIKLQSLNRLSECHVMDWHLRPLCMIWSYICWET